MPLLAAAGCAAEVSDDTQAFSVQSDPCRAEGADRCGDSGACVWLDRGVDTCVAAFGILEVPAAADITLEPLLVLPERYVTLAELADAPLTDAELTVALANGADVYHNIMESAGLLGEGDEVRYHSSSYCGHGNSGWVNQTHYAGSMQVCGASACHYHKYNHYVSIPSWTFIHSEWRSCG
jgi:hypothetical protein